MSKPEYLVWMDLETTGLDPQEEGAGILELYGVITDTTPEFNIVGEPLHLIRRHKIGELRFSLFTLQMHAKSGLFEDMAKPKSKIEVVDGRCEEVWIDYPWKWMPEDPKILGLYLFNWVAFGGLPMEERANATMLEYEHKPYLAGSSIHFDRKWLEVFENGGFLRAISYRNYDVSTLWMQHEVITGEPPCGVNETTLHRAKDDIMRSIEIARACAKGAVGE